jgi:hypothetical protein
MYTLRWTFGNKPLYGWNFESFERDPFGKLLRRKRGKTSEIQIENEP